MSLPILSSRFAVLAVIMLIVSPALAQQRNYGRQGMLQAKSVDNLKGTFVMAGQNQIQISVGQNQPILVMVGPDTEVSVSGTAEQDYLKAGVTVEFVAEVNKTHTVKDKIDKLTIVTLTADQPAGLDSAEAPAAEKKGGKAGGDAQGGDMFNDKSNKPDKPAKAVKNVPQFPGTYTVRGTLKMVKDGKITVAAGRGPIVKAELATDATIDVALTDFHAVERDDKVTVSGVTDQAHPNMLLAKSIKIDMVNPLTGTKKHAARPAKTPAEPASKAKKGGDPDDLLGSGK